MNLLTLKALLSKEEGDRYFPYDDATGKQLKIGMTIIGNISIGRGRNLSGIGISRAELELMNDSDIDRAIENLEGIFPKWSFFSDRRQMALISLMFMGKGHFLTFEKMIPAIKEDRWDGAANELLDSKYAIKTGVRAIELSQMLRNG